MEDLIIQEVEDFCRVKYQDMRSPSRKNSIVKARHLAFHFLREYTRLSQTEVGALFFRDHATVLHGCTSVKNQYEYDRHFRKDIIPLELRIKAIVENSKTVNSEVWGENDFYTNN